MNCPYCNSEMEKGYLQSPRPVFWSRKSKNLFTAAGSGDIRLTKWGWNCYNDKAYVCKGCGKMIIDLK